MHFRKGAFAVLSFLFLTTSKYAVAEGPRPLFASNPIRITAAAGATTTIKLVDLLKDVGPGKPLIWGTGPVASIPKYVSVDKSAGTMTIAPALTDAGDPPAFILTVGMLGDLGEPEPGDLANVNLHVFTNPQWKITEFNIKAMEDTDYTENLAQAKYVVDPSGEPIQSFSLEEVPRAKPSWLNFAMNGALSGKPLRAHVGKFDGFFFVAHTKSGGSAKIPVTGEVVKLFKGPKWVGPNLTLPNAIEDSEYKHNVSGSMYITYNEPEPLKFEVFDGKNRNWITMDTAGELKGIPLRVNKGAVELKTRASVTYEGKLYQDETTFKFDVILINKPPAWTKNVIVLPDAFTRIPYTAVNLRPFVVDPDENPVLTFRILKRPTPAWGDITTVGVFSGTPANANLLPVPNEWEVEVSDGEFPAVAKIQITVKNRPPIWKNKPTILKPDAVEDSLYKMPMAQYAVDPEGDPLTFEIVSGPAWAKINAAGELEGTPVRPTDIGLQKWVMKVTDTISGGFDQTEVQVTVGKINKPPMWTMPEITLPDAPERVDYMQSLKQYVVDPDPTDTLEFRKVTPTEAAWLPLAKDGSLKGKPVRADVGKHTFTVEVKDVPGGLTALAKVHVTVVKVNQIPLCKNPVLLKDAVAGKAFLDDLKRVASDPDNDVLTFTPIKAPAWLKTGPDGKLTGTALEADVGPYKAEFKVTDPDMGECILLADGRVLTGNAPPQWVKNPLILPDAYVNEQYAQRLLNFVIDPDVGDKLTFEQLNMSTWIVVANTGLFFGIPAMTDLGLHKMNVRVTDGKAFADAEVHVTVKQKGERPKWTKDPIDLGTAVVDQRFSFDLTKHVTDADGSPLTYRKPVQARPPWLSATAGGEAFGTPKETDLGRYDTMFQVSDNGIDWISVRAFGTVIKGQPPTWKQDPIRFEAIENKPFTNTLADKINNPGGMAVTFKKNGGKPWLNIATAGALSGTPLTADLGENFFPVLLEYPGGSVGATVIVNVLPDAPTEDGVIIDDPVPGARTDNLWIVDNTSDPCSGPSCFIADLKDSIDVYFDALEAASIHHYGVFLNADACTDPRAPIRDSAGKVLLSYGDPDWVRGFRYRADRIRTTFSTSPITALWQFHYYMESTIPTPYFESRIPFEVMFLTDHGDGYTPYVNHTASHWAPIRKWVPDDFRDYAIKEAKAAEKPLRVSALAKKGSLAYTQMTSGTGGSYFYLGGSDMDDYLKEFADQVIFRAYVTAKKRVKLTKKPTDVSSIKVTIGGRPLATNQWRYDAAANEVEIFWHLIDLSKLGKGERLVISYK